MAELGLNIARADGSSLAALSDVSSKGDHDSGHSLVIALVQVGRHSKISAVGLPFLPNFLLIVGSCLHLAIDNPCITSLHMTFEDITKLRQNPVQEF